MSFTGDTDLDDLDNVLCDFFLTALLPYLPLQLVKQSMGKCF